MALKRVPGVRNYFADDSGIKEIALSDDMSDFMMSVGERMAGNANAVGDSEYEARRTIVRSGWENQPRQGVEVTEKTADPGDARDEVLLRVEQAMQIRNRR